MMIHTTTNLHNYVTFNGKFNKTDSEEEIINEIQKLIDVTYSMDGFNYNHRPIISLIVYSEFSSNKLKNEYSKDIMLRAYKLNRLLNSKRSGRILDMVQQYLPNSRLHSVGWEYDYPLERYTLSFDELGIDDLKVLKNLSSYTCGEVIMDIHVNPKLQLTRR